MLLSTETDLADIFSPKLVVPKNTINVTVDDVRIALKKALKTVVERNGYIFCMGWADFSPSCYDRNVSHQFSYLNQRSDIIAVIESVRTQALKVLGIKLPPQYLIRIPAIDQFITYRELLGHVMYFLVGKDKALALLGQDGTTLGDFEKVPCREKTEMPPTSEQVLKIIWKVAKSLLGKKLNKVQVEQNGAWDGTIDFSSFLTGIPEDKYSVERLIQILTVCKLQSGYIIPPESDIVIPKLKGSTLGLIFESVYPWVIIGKEKPETDGRSIVLPEEDTKGYSDILSKTFRTAEGETRVLHKMPSWKICSEEHYQKPNMVNGFNTNSELYAVLAEAVHPKSYLAFRGILRISFSSTFVKLIISPDDTVHSLAERLFSQILGFKWYKTGEKDKKIEVPYYDAYARTDGDFDDFSEVAAICLSAGRFLNHDIMFNFRGRIGRVRPDNTIDELTTAFITENVLKKWLSGNVSSTDGSHGDKNVLPWDSRFLHS